MKKRALRPSSLVRSLADKIDLEAAMVPARTANDLLPPREDDNVAGQLGKRFVEHLKSRIASGTYSPDRAEFVRVPKPGFTSRPAAALTLTDRVVYESLVAALRPAILEYLVPDEILFWPRESPSSRKRWKEFEQAPLSTATKYVVRADIAGFYDSIEHGNLKDDLIQATGDAEVVETLVHFLSIVMGSSRGLPQGLQASDTLATTFLQKVDAAMVRAGLTYWRHGDDIRIAVSSISEARSAIASFEEELRGRGLLVNSSKCAIVPIDDYAVELNSTEQTFEKAQSILYRARVAHLSRDHDALGRAMKEANLDSQLAWDLFYHASISVDVVIEKLREHIEPKDVDVAARLFTEAMDNQQSEEHSAPRSIFHHQIVSSLIRLAAGRSPSALPRCASLVARFPEKTAIACRYLGAMTSTHEAQVAAQIEDVLTSDVYSTPWQKAWLLRAFSPIAHVASGAMVAQLMELAYSESIDWLARVEAMKALARRGDLEQKFATLAWKRAPRAYRSDLLAAIAYMGTTAKWASRFVAVTHLDPIEKVVLSRITTPGQLRGE